MIHFEEGREKNEFLSESNGLLCQKLLKVVKQHLLGNNDKPRNSYVLNKKGW